MDGDGEGGMRDCEGEGVVGESEVIGTGDIGCGESGDGELVLLPPS